MAQFTADDLMFKPGLMSGERILITGGGTGLGKVMAEALLMLGAEVYICGRRGGVVEATARELMDAHGGKCVGLACDIRVPEAIAEMLAARNFQSGMATVRQLEFALFDMAIHGDFDPANDSVAALLERIRDEVAVNRPPAWHRFPQQFSHIFAGGYAAGYYSYKWAEVLSADAYAAFEEAPDRLAETGARFLAEVLSRGGSRSALENFTAFRGRAPRIDALLRHAGMAAGAA